MIETAETDMCQSRQLSDRAKIGQIKYCSESKTKFLSICKWRRIRIRRLSLKTVRDSNLRSAGHFDGVWHAQLVTIPDLMRTYVVLWHCELEVHGALCSSCSSRLVAIELVLFMTFMLDACQRKYNGHGKVYWMNRSTAGHSVFLGIRRIPVFTLLFTREDRYLLISLTADIFEFLHSNGIVDAIRGWDMSLTHSRT